MARFKTKLTFYVDVNAKDKHEAKLRAKVIAEGMVTGRSSSNVPFSYAPSFTLTKTSCVRKLHNYDGDAPANEEEEEEEEEGIDCFENGVPGSQ